MYKMTIDKTDVVGWLGNILFILGAWFLAQQKAEGLWCNAVANLTYVYVAFKDKRSSLFVLSIILIGINLYGVWYWMGKS